MRCISPNFRQPLTDLITFRAFFFFESIFYEGRDYALELCISLYWLRIHSVNAYFLAESHLENVPGVLQGGIVGLCVWVMGYRKTDYFLGVIRSFLRKHIEWGFHNSCIWLKVLFTVQLIAFCWPLQLLQSPVMFWALTEKSKQSSTV